MVERIKIRMARVSGDISCVPGWLTFSGKVPTVPGWYWVRDPQCRDTDWVTRIFEPDNGVYVCLTRYGEWCSVAGKHGLVFADEPIPEPLPVEDA